MNDFGPKLWMNEQIVRQNIHRMAEKCRSLGLELQPHMKTHQSHRVGDWLREEGVKAITVSSVGMAEYFIRAGWTDITIAFPVNILEIPRISRLAGKVSLTLLTDQRSVIKALDSAGIQARLVLEIDTGSQRSGLDPSKREGVAQLIEEIRSLNTLTFAGLYSHAGHNYSCRSEKEIMASGAAAVGKIGDLHDLLGIGEKIYYGDTPACSRLTDFNKTGVLTPGNFVFYDVMQVYIGACGWEDIGVALDCPVVSVHEERQEIVIHGGAIHLSKDRLEGELFGIPVRLTGDGWGEPMASCRLRSISQEHGIIRLSDEENGKWRPGERIGILPIHSCLTAECMGAYINTTDGSAIDHFSAKKEAG